MSSLGQPSCRSLHGSSEDHLQWWLKCWLNMHSVCITQAGSHCLPADADLVAHFHKNLPQKTWDATKPLNIKQQSKNCTNKQTEELCSLLFETSSLQNCRYHPCAQYMLNNLITSRQDDFNWAFSLPRERKVSILAFRTGALTLEGGSQGPFGK